MSKRFILSLILFLPFILKGQEVPLSEPMTDLQSICVSLTQAVQSYSERNIEDANRAYRRFCSKHRIGAMPVNNVERQVSESSLEGRYVVFLPEFFDSLLDGDNAYLLSKELKAHFERNRGEKKTRGRSKSKYEYFQKDLVIGPGETITFEVTDRPSPFEIIAIASPGGAFSMDVYDMKRNDHYNEKDNEMQGAICRSRAIDGEKDGSYRITLRNRVATGSYSIVVFCN